MEDSGPAGGEEQGPEGAGPSGREQLPAAVRSVYLLVFLAQIGVSSVVPLLPVIKGEFDLSAYQIGFVLSAFALGRVVADLPAGWLNDRLPPERLLPIASLFVLVGGVVGGFSPSFPVLLAARFVSGLGTALYIVTALTILVAVAPEGQHGRVYGGYQGALLSGAAISPAIGGILGTLVSWRGVVAISGFLAFLGLVVVWVTAPRRSWVEGERKTGVATSGGGKSADLRLTLITANAATFVIFFGVAGFRNEVVPLFAHEELGIAVSVIGLAIGFETLFRTGITYVSGVISDRYGRRRVLLIGLGLIGAGFLAFFFARTPGLFFLAMAIQAFGGFGNSIPLVLLIDAVDPGRRGFFQGMNRFIGDFGIMLGPVFLGFLYDRSGFLAPVIAVLVVVCLMMFLTLVEGRNYRRVQALGREIQTQS